MDGAIVEVGIGLVLIFFVFSVVVSGLYEAVAKVLAWRSKSLWAAIHLLVDDAPPPEGPQPMERLRNASPTGDARPVVGDAATQRPTTTEQLYAHPLIGGLEQRARSAKTRIDRIEPNNFARGLIDVLVPDAAGATSVSAWKARLDEARIPAVLKRQLGVLVREAGDDLGKLRDGVAGWFDDQMSTLTRGYRKRARLFTVVFGLAVACACNVDAISAARDLYRDDVTRSALVARADDVVDRCAGQEGDQLSDCLADAGKTTSGSIDLPVGWAGADVDALSVLGWVVGGLAISQGAPFWFDVLKRATSSRRGRAAPAPR